MRFRNKIIMIVGAFLFSLFILGVNVNNNVFENELFAVNTSSSSVTKISLDKKNLNLIVGETSKLNVSYTPSNVGSSELIWVSNNKNVVTVDNNGNIKAVGVGSAYVIVVLKNNYSIRDVCNVRVSGSNSNTNSSTNSNVNVTSVSFNKKSMTVEKGANGILAVNVLPANATNKKLFWSSSNTSVLSVDGNGKITALKEGTAVITVSSQANSNLSDTCTITVKDKSNSTTSNETSNTTTNTTNSTTKTTDTAISANTQKFLASLDKMSKKVQSDYKKYGKNGWRYNYTRSKDSFQKALDSSRPRYSVCHRLPTWGLIDIGVLKTGDIWNTPKGNIHYLRSGMKSRMKKALTYYDGKNKSPEKLVKEGKLKAGDIMIYAGRNHSDVYAGDGKFYDGGQTIRFGKGFVWFTKKERNKYHGTGYFKTFGPVSMPHVYKEYKVKKYLRLK